MLAYHNDPKIKQEILQQLYTPDYKIPMEEYETRFGIPEVLVYLQRAIFEELSPVVTKQLHINFMSAIPVGADLSGIWKDFATWMLIDPADGVIQYTNTVTKAHEVILRVANLYQHGYTTQQMRDACDAAYAVANAASATASATCSVAYAVIYYSANAARSAAAAAAYAAYANAYDDAASAFYATAAVYSAVDAHSITATSYAFDDYTIDAIYTKMSNKLIELLQNSDKTRIENASLP